MNTWTGLTWNHSRGHSALAAAASGPDAPQCDVRWETATLDSAPIGVVARQYDLIMIEHPQLGEAIATGSLQSIDSVFSPDEVAAWRSDSVGPAADSYAMAGQWWALPMDVATQVSARNDVAIPLPDNWIEAVELSADVAVVLPTTGAHPFLSLCAIAVANGARPGAGPQFLTEAEVCNAVEPLRHFASGHEGLHNPTAVLEQMAAADGPTYCPLVDGYAGGDNPVLFGDAPRGTAGRRGSALGGTGLAFSAGCDPDDALLDHVRWLMRPDVQRDFLTAYSGQPGSVAAWNDSTLDAATNGFYRETRATVGDAWIRPRHDGAVAFQGAAADAVRNCLFDHRDAGRLTRVINVLYEASLEPRESRKARATASMDAGEANP